MSEWKEFEEWFHEEFIGSKKLDDVSGSSYYKRFLARLSGTAKKYTGEMRMQYFIRLRYGFPLRKDGYITAVFSAKTKDTAAIYAMCYLDMTSDEITYVCASPTFDSKDGEYRHHFVTYEAFEKGYNALIDPLSKIELEFLGAIASGELGIDVRLYPNVPDKAKNIENDRIPLKLLVVALSLSAGGILQTHTVPEYARFVRTVLALRPKVDEIAEKLAHNPDIGYFARGSPAGLRVECGQKITPMTLRETMEPLDINYASWREEFARQQASNLVINAVCPSMPLSNQWFLIEGADGGLFENIAMLNKLKRGKTTEISVGHLREARHDLSSILTDPTLEHSAVESLDSHVYDSIMQAQSYLLMSSVALCSTMEHTRITMGSLPRMYANSPIARPFWTALITEPCHAAKYMFDILYGAHALHTRSHIIHSDLHANNFTLHQYSELFRPVANTHKEKKEGGARIVLPPVQYELLLNNPIVAYVAGSRGEHDTFVFPYAGLVGCIIDFSRSIFGPGMNETLVKEFGADYTRNFYRDQIGRTLRAFHRHAPGFVEKHQEAIKGALLADPDAAFRVLSYVDFVSAGASTAHILTQPVPPDPRGIPDLRKFQPVQACIDVCKRIEKVAREHLISRLHDLIAPTRDRTQKIPFAGDVLFHALFSEYQYTSFMANLTKRDQKTGAGEAKESLQTSKNADYTLCDVYNINVSIRWDGRDYDKFPPWARLDHIEKKLGGIKLSEILGRGVEPFLESLIPSPRVDIIAETLRAEQSALDAPAAATSSWIE